MFLQYVEYIVDFLLSMDHSYALHWSEQLQNDHTYAKNWLETSDKKVDNWPNFGNVQDEEESKETFDNLHQSPTSSSQSAGTPSTHGKLTSRASDDLRKEVYVPNPGGDTGTSKKVRKSQKNHLSLTGIFSVYALLFDQNLAFVPYVLESKFPPLLLEVYNNFSDKAKVFALIQPKLSKVTRRGYVKEVTQKLKINRNYPLRLAKKISDGHSLERTKGSGRPTKMTPEKITLLNNVLQENNFDCTFQKLGKETGLGAETVRRFMAKNGYRKTGKYLRPYLSPKHKEARKLWAIQHLNDDFSNTVDVDEKVGYAKL